MLYIAGEREETSLERIRGIVPNATIGPFTNWDGSVTSQGLYRVAPSSVDQVQQVVGR